LCSWIIDPLECPSDEASLPFTLPIFRLYAISYLISGGGYHRMDDILCTISTIETLMNTTQKDGTLVNAFGKRGCQ
jgi:hypothetical protein